MLIARALPIMRVYIKPGGQRGYSGHCINLPQNVGELAHSLPRYPKDLSVIVVKMQGKDNSFKDVTVRRQNVADALHWLINNNPYYKDIIINNDSTKINHAFSMQNFRNYYSNLPILERTFLIYDYY